MKLSTLLRAQNGQKPVPIIQFTGLTVHCVSGFETDPQMRIPRAKTFSDL